MNPKDDKFWNLYFKFLLILSNIFFFKKCLKLKCSILAVAIVVVSSLKSSRQNHQLSLDASKFLYLFMSMAGRSVDYLACSTASSLDYFFES